MSTIASSEQSSVQAGRRPLIRRIYVVLGVIAALAIAGLFIWAVIWLARTQAAAIETVRDIFIIALALTSCLSGIVLMMLLIMVIRLVNMLEFEIKPILEKTNETVTMVRGTTAFVSHNVVRPVTTASSYLAGIRRGLRTLFGDPRKNLED